MSELIYLNNKRAAARFAGHGLRLNGINEYVQFFPRTTLTLQGNTPSLLVTVGFVLHSLAANQCIWHFTADNVAQGGQMLLVQTNGTVRYGPSVDTSLQYIIPANIQVGVLYEITLVVPISATDGRLWYPGFQMLVNSTLYNAGNSPTNGNASIGAGNNSTPATRILLGARATSGAAQSSYANATIYNYYMSGVIALSGTPQFNITHLHKLHNLGYGCNPRTLTPKYVNFTMARVDFSPDRVSGTNILTGQYCNGNTATVVNAASLPASKFPTRRIGKTILTVYP